jgi:argininosuccinate lyase
VRSITGGPAPAAVAVQIADQKELLARDVAWAEETRAALSSALEHLILESRRLVA